MRTTTIPVPGPRRGRRFVLVGAIVAAVALGASACGGGDDSDVAADSADTTTTVAAGQSPTESQTGGQSSSGGTQTGGDTGGGSTGGGGSTSPAPTIVSFETPEDIDCHNANLQNFTASWTTTNADNVTISIDGAGVYNTYDANGSASLPFNCSSSHTFLLTAHGAGGQTATRSITLEPRNVQTSTTEDPP